jgi:hypothetical protein
MSGLYRLDEPNPPLQAGYGMGERIRGNETAVFNVVTIWSTYCTPLGMITNTPSSPRTYCT